MNDEFIISMEPQSEDQKNRERIGLLRVADNYPKESKSRKLLLKHIAESYEQDIPPLWSNGRETAITHNWLLLD